MALASAKPTSTKHPRSTHSVAKGAARCRHFTADGTRCRLPILDASSHLCFRHAQIAAASESSQHDYEDLSAELLPGLSEFAAGADIRQFLARLLVLVTKGRISPRRASVLGYITNQLLHSHRAIDRENFLQLADAPQKDRTVIWDVPGLNPISGETRS
jgi:hypothetical protein